MADDDLDYLRKQDIINALNTSGRLLDFLTLLASDAYDARETWYCLRSMREIKQERFMSSKYLAAALFGLALISAPALAQTTTETPDAITNISQGDASQWRSSKLIGMNVYNNINEKIGHISDMLVDQNGKIQGVILSVGGFLGMGEHLVAVKFENLKWVTTSGSASPAPNPAGTLYPDHAVLNATKDRLKSMPEFSAVSEN